MPGPAERRGCVRRVGHAGGRRSRADGRPRRLARRDARLPVRRRRGRLRLVAARPRAGGRAPARRCALHARPGRRCRCRARHRDLVRAGRLHRRRLLPPRPHPEARDAPFALAARRRGVQARRAASRVRVPDVARLARARGAARRRHADECRRARGEHPRADRPRALLRDGLGDLPLDRARGRRGSRAARVQGVRARARRRLSLPLGTGERRHAAARAGRGRVLLLLHAQADVADGRDARRDLGLARARPPDLRAVRGDSAGRVRDRPRAPHPGPGLPHGRCRLRRLRAADGARVPLAGAGRPADDPGLSQSRAARAEPAPLPQRSRGALTRALQPGPGPHRPERSRDDRRAASGAPRVLRTAPALGRARARRNGCGARDRALAARLPALRERRLALAGAAVDRIHPVRGGPRGRGRDRRPLHADARARRRVGVRNLAPGCVCRQLRAAGPEDGARDRRLVRALRRHRRAGRRRSPRVAAPRGAAAGRLSPARGRRRAGRLAPRPARRGPRLLEVDAAGQARPARADAGVDPLPAARRGAAVGPLRDLATSYRATAFAPVYVVAVPPTHAANTRPNELAKRKRGVLRFFTYPSLEEPQAWGAQWLVLTRSGPVRAIERDGLRPRYEDDRFVVFRVPPGRP